MRPSPEPRTILVVESDVVLGRVLSRVLAGENLRVVHAVNGAEALQLAALHPPRLVLLDDCPGKGNGRELATELSQRNGGFPVIVMTADPSPGPPLSPRTGPCAHWLRKPFNLHDLRQAVDAVFAASPEPAIAPLATPPSFPVTAPAVASAKEFCMREFSPAKVMKGVGYLVLAVLVLGGLAVALGAIPAPWDPREETDDEPPAKPTRGVQLLAPDAVRVGFSGVAPWSATPYRTLLVPEDVQVALGMRKGNIDLVHAVKKPTRTQPLVMPGSTALDPARLLRLRARFAPAELVKIGEVPEFSAKGTDSRELRTGDKVTKGLLLGVFYSDVVGNKKNDLVDAILQLNLDEKILLRAKAKAEAVPEIFLLNAQRNVQGDLNAINRAMNTLKTWGVPEEAIESLVGTRILQAIKGKASWDLPEKDVQILKEKAKDTSEWGRVELKSPIDGILIERNVALHELVQDPTVNLFQIAQVDRLNVLANVPEDELPRLYRLREALKGRPIPWTVQTVGSEPIPGFIDDIGYLIDPNQHTAVVKGHIDNPTHQLRAGQFITATVAMLPPPNVVEVPMDAVVEDGQQAIVFVQTDATKHYYQMRRVEITHRFKDSAFVRCREEDIKMPLTREEKEKEKEKELGLFPKEALHKGDRVILRGAVELKAALLDKEAEQDTGEKENKDG